MKTTIALAIALACGLPTAALAEGDANHHATVASSAAATAAVQIDEDVENEEDGAETPLRSSAMLYGGYTSPTNGYEDRYYGGFMLDKYVGDLGIHLDTVAVSREQSGAYASIGTSFSVAPGIRPRVAFGGSTDVFNILPKYFAQAQVRTEITKSTVAIPMYTYRKFRTGVEEHQAALEGVHYFDLGDANGYYVAQLRGAYAFLPGKDAPSVGGGFTAVRSSGVSFGVYGEYGRLAYANLIDIGAPGIESEFWAVRPSIGIRIDRSMELVVRGEYSENDFFSTRGVFVGLKAHLD